MTKKKINKKAINLTPSDKNLSNINSLSNTPTKANIKYWAGKHLDLEELLECVIKKMSAKENYITISHNDTLKITYSVLKDIKKFILKIKHEEYCDLCDRLEEQNTVTGHNR